MTFATHGRLADILADVEARCATYEWHPLAEAQRWADDNGPFRNTRLADVIQQGVWYCQLNGMDQTIGFELNKLGGSVCRLLDINLTERIAKVELYEAIVLLEEFARRVRSLIECPAADVPSQSAANKCAPEPDGPYGNGRWRHNGELLIDTMQAGSWRIMNHLWQQPCRTAQIEQLLEVAYGDRMHAISKDAFQSFCRGANKYFKKHGIPLAATMKNGCIFLTNAK